LGKLAQDAKNQVSVYPHRILKQTLGRPGCYERRAGTAINSPSELTGLNVRITSEIGNQTYASVQPPKKKRQPTRVGKGAHVSLGQEVANRLMNKRENRFEQAMPGGTGGEVAPSRTRWQREGQHRLRNPFEPEE